MLVRLDEFRDKSRIFITDGAMALRYPTIMALALLVKAVPPVATVNTERPQALYAHNRATPYQQQRCPHDLGPITKIFLANPAGMPYNQSASKAEEKGSGYYML